MKVTGTLVCEANTEQWKQYRKTGIGASEAAAALGVSPWSTALEIYHVKRGELPEFDGNVATRWGQLLEPAVLQLFTDETGIQITGYCPGLFRHDQHHFMLATPDAIAGDGVGVETKTTMSRTEMGENGSDEAPISWWLQAQQQIAVCGFQTVYIAAAILDTRQLKWFQIDRDDEIISHLVSAERILWDQIQQGTPPEPDWEHESTAKLLRSRFPDFDATAERKLTTNAQAAWEQAERLGERIKQMETQRKLLQGHAIKELDDAAYGVFPDGERMLRRKTIAASESMVKRKERIDIRCVKVPKAKKKGSAK